MSELIHGSMAQCFIVSVSETFIYYCFLDSQGDNLAVFFFLCCISVALPSWPFTQQEKKTNVRQMMSIKMPFTFLWRCGSWQSAWLMKCLFTSFSDLQHSPVWVKRQFQPPRDILPLVVLPSEAKRYLTTYLELLALFTEGLIFPMEWPVMLHVSQYTGYSCLSLMWASVHFNM